MKPIIISTRYAWMAFFLLKNFGPRLHVFANVFGNSFANSQRYMKKIFEKHFQDLKFSPPVSNAFPLTKQNSPLMKSSS
jgi:hypothetical protein